jgi:hypothetical protein
MKIFNVFSRALIVIIALSASGCSSITESDTPHVNRNFFGAKKTFAVVSLASYRIIPEAKGMSQIFRSADAIPGANSQTIINKLDPILIRTLGSTKHFTLLPENKVQKSNVYKNLAEDERVTDELFMSDKINVANKYKYVSDKQTYAQLAQDLDVDGVIGIMMHFVISPGNRSISRMGLSLGMQNYNVMVSISVIAYNKNEAVIWQDSTIQGVDPNDANANILINTSGMTSADFQKFYPSAIETGGKAMDSLLARLDAMMIGNEISPMRRIK